ncbi:GDP-fucose protein O-fucosyltransferase [Sesbania bispinosa]|nr:GDP-fucose protein O-fucosyltransferase [Sesbania bispinosa]
MHPYNRLPSSGHSTPSPPPSPLRSPRLRHARSKTGRFSPAQPPTRTVSQRLAWLFLSVLLRRQGVFLFAPLIYISGMLLYFGTVSFDIVPIIKHRPAPGSVYRSPELYAKLRPEMDADNSSADAISTIWKTPYKGGEWKPCVDRSSEGLPESNGYIYVEANGGLNQQRASICNAVAVAGYLNATLVIPIFIIIAYGKILGNFLAGKWHPITELAFVHSVIHQHRLQTATEKTSPVLLLLEIDFIVLNYSRSMAFEYK